jgi:probable phosphoglycerate mutase
VSRRRVYLLRHGAVRYFTEDGRPVSAPTVPLSPEGREQARAAAEALAHVPFDRAIVSGLPRTVETAGIVLGNRSLPLEQIEAFHEIRGGRLADIPEDRVEEEFLAAFHPGLEPDSRFLGGETFGSLLARVVPAFEALCADESWSELLLVLHGAVNRAILAHALGAGLRLFASVEQDPACLNILDVEPGHVVVRLVNYTPYEPLKGGSRLTTMERLYLEYRGRAG